MTPPHSLELVTAAFDDWRSHQSSPGSRIPLALKEQAVELLQTHPISQVLKSLKVNHTTLKRWQRQQTTDNDCSFVPLISPVQSALHVTLRNADGGELIITGLTLSQITTLATQFSASPFSGESR